MAAIFPGSGTPGFAMPLADRLAADVFRKSYRRFLELRPTHYRWSHLAPQSIGHLQTACDEHWSVEKLADYLHCPPEEAADCMRRFLMSKKVNAQATTAARMRQAMIAWLGDVSDWDEATRDKLAEELAKQMGNQLYLAAQAKEDLLEISRELEGTESQAAPKDQVKPDLPAADASPPSPKWGPQWKD